MQLQEITVLPAIKTQDTINKNIHDTIKLNEEFAQQDHERLITIKIAYLHFCNAIPL